MKMRKFNLKGTVVQRMRGIPKEEPKPKETENPASRAEPLYCAGFTEKQGLIQYAWRTDTGRVRRNNQDAVILGNGLAGIADGMGGHSGGEIASAGLRDGLLKEIRDCEPDSMKLEDAIRKVNLELWEQQEHDASLTGMGTTLTAVWPAAKEMIIAQVGDSRAYLYREGELIQVTEDHSMVADMVRKGVLTEEQAACHPMRNYITRAVGTDDTVEPDIMRHDRRQGDIWLICSDGLHGMVSKSAICGMIRPDDLEDTAEKLMKAALENGGKDNISFVILRDDTEQPTRDEEDDTSGDKAETPADEADNAEEVSGR